MSVVQYFRVESPDGVTLKTAKKYCKHDLLIKPKLALLTVKKNGNYSVPPLFAGYGKVSVNVEMKKEQEFTTKVNGEFKPADGTVYSSVKVDVPVKKEVTLHVTKNGTYDAPEGYVYNKIVVDIPQGDQGGGEVFTPDTGEFTIEVGATEFIGTVLAYPIVEYPEECLEYTYKSDGVLRFTGKAVGSGTIYVRGVDGVLYGQYTINVIETTHEHNYTSTVVTPSCTEYGYTLYECSCGDSYISESSEPNGHNFVNGWTIEVEPTCTGAGKEVRVCFTCGDIQERSVDALGHDWFYYEDTGASSGYSRRCTRCGEVETDVPEP